MIRATGPIGNKNIYKSLQICSLIKEIKIYKLYGGFNYALFYFLDFFYNKAPRLVKRFRNDLIKKYSLLSGGEDSVIADYIYHCNVQKPS